MMNAPTDSKSQRSMRPQDRSVSTYLYVDVLFSGLYI